MGQFYFGRVGQNSIGIDNIENVTRRFLANENRFDGDTAKILPGQPMDIPEGRWGDLRFEMPSRASKTPMDDKPIEQDGGSPRRMVSANAR